jgi:hypothetical protein
MPYIVAQEQLNDLRKAFAEKHSYQTTLHDADITELVNKSLGKAVGFEQQFASVVEAMLALEGSSALGVVGDDELELRRVRLHVDVLAD